MRIVTLSKLIFIGVLFASIPPAYGRPQAGNAAIIDDAILVATASPTASGLIASDEVAISPSNIEHLKAVAILKGPYNSFAFSADGIRLALGGADGMIHFVEVKTLNNLATLTGPQERISSLAFSSDGKHLASGSIDSGSTRLWDLQTSKQVFTVPCSIGCYALAFSPDGRLLFGGEAGEFGRVVIWDTATGKEVAALSDGTENYVVTMALSSDGKRLAVGKSAGDLEIVDAATQTLIVGLKDKTFIPSSVGFSSNGKLLAAAGRDGTIGLWDMANYARLNLLIRHTDFVSTVAFSPDGSLLVSGSYDKSFRLWDVSRAKELAIFDGLADAVYNAAFSPDGHLLVTLTADGIVTLWAVSAGS